MSTSEAQVIARALYDSLINSTLQSLRVAATELSRSNGEGVEQRMAAVLPADTPRQLRNLLIALAQERTLDQLPLVATAFEQYVQEAAQETLTGEVISAVALDAPQQARITEELRQRYGKGLELRFSVDETIIGGLIIRIGDRVLDNSLRSRLSAIQRNMLAS